MKNDPVHTCLLSEDLIGTIADYLTERPRELSRIAIVFPGERPRHFLNRELSKRLSHSFFSPYYFTIDAFIDYVLLKNKPFTKVSEMDASYILYTIIKKNMPKLLPVVGTFSSFLPWARELIHIIDQLDIDCVEPDKLKSSQSFLSLGYDIPDGISELLENIYELRNALHAVLKTRSSFTRALRYTETLKVLDTIPLSEFDEVYFAGFFFMHEAEKRIIKKLYDRSQARFFFQGNASEWPVLKDVAHFFNLSIVTEKEATLPFNECMLYAGFDTHSQASIAHRLLKDIARADEKDTVIVLPNPDTVIPLLSELSIENNDFNVSMGYPLVRSSFYSLCELIFTAQESRRKDCYYSRDYLKVLRHPILKNLSNTKDAALTRAVIHKIEEFLLGMQDTAIGSSLFIDLSLVETLAELPQAVMNTLHDAESLHVTDDDIKSIVLEIHTLAFRLWEGVRSLDRFARTMETFIDGLLTFKVFSKDYPLNTNIVDRILGILDEIRIAEYRDETFDQSEIFTLFLKRVEGEKIAFKGTPLNGLQILGRLETRSLTFKNVIILDMNEGVMPQGVQSSALLPREVLTALGLQRIERAEEIERYHCMRLIRGAQNVSFVYDGRADKEKSRFIAELEWIRQQSSGTLASIPEARASYSLSLGDSQRVVKKEPYLIEYLKNEFVFSATSLNTYLECPLKFYYQYALRLKEKEDFLEEPEGADVGTFIHELLETELGIFVGKKPLYDEAFNNSFFAAFHKKFEAEFVRQMKSDSFAVREVMLYRLKQFLEYDAARPVASIIGLEKEYKGVLPLASCSINIVAKVDRIDRMDGGEIVVLDYKTGSKVKTPAKLSALEGCDLNDRKSIKKLVRSFQLPLYMYFVMQDFPDIPCDAGLYQLRNLDITYFSKKVEEYPFSESLALTFSALESIVAELFNPGVPFDADHSNQATCEHCPFLGFCS
jgi:hypothetical protein